MVLFDEPYIFCFQKTENKIDGKLPFETKKVPTSSDKMYRRQPSNCGAFLAKNSKSN